MADDLDIPAIINECSDWDYRFDPDGPMTPMFSVHLVSVLDFETMMGGLKTFYYNSSGDLAPQTVDALRFIGAMRSADALLKANRIVQGDLPDWPGGDSAEKYEFLYQWPQDQWRMLQDEIYQEDFRERLEEWIRCHLADIDRERQEYRR